jgi:hypothetical protein
MLKVKVPTIFSAHSGFRHAGMDIKIGDIKLYNGDL